MTEADSGAERSAAERSAAERSAAAAEQTRRTEQEYLAADRTAPTPRELPGIRWVVLGALLAVLAPLFGFLVGSMSGIPEGGDALDALFLPLVVGLSVGAIGALIAFMFGIRLFRQLRQRSAPH